MKDEKLKRRYTALAYDEEKYPGWVMTASGPVKLDSNRGAALFVSMIIEGMQKQSAPLMGTGAAILAELTDAYDHEDDIRENIRSAREEFLKALADKNLSEDLLNFDPETGELSAKSKGFHLTGVSGTA